MIIPIILAIVVIVSACLIPLIKVRLAYGAMRPLDSREVTPGVYAVRTSFVNLYLVKGGDRYIAFDAGTDEAATKAALRGLGIDERDVSAVFLTHTDYDHVAAVPLFSSAQVYMADSNRSFLGEKRGLTRSKAFAVMGRDYTALYDGETITVAGVRVQCVFTPGHTPGSACYLVDGKYLFTGDSLNLKDGKAVLFYGVFNMNNGKQRQSLRELSKLDGIEAVFTMHTGYTTDFKTAFAGWR